MARLQGTISVQHAAEEPLQKLIIGGEMLQNSKCLIAVNLTHGLDASVTEQVRNEPISYRNHVGHVILVSEDLDEPPALSDMTVVACEDHLSEPIQRAKFDKLGIGAMMLGERRSKPIPHFKVKNLK